MMKTDCKITDLLKISLIILLSFSLTACNVGSDQPDVTEDQLLADGSVAYLGPAGTYTEEATQFFFPQALAYLPKESVAEALKELQEGKVDYAVIPQENSLGGATINYIAELIAAEDIYVVGEVILPISQTLMGIPGSSLSDIRLVVSHAQGLAQSAKWRQDNLPDAQSEEMASTAAAAEYVAASKDISIAAVAAPGAAALYGLQVLAENVQISSANRTRFYVLAKQMRTGNHQRAVFIAECKAEEFDDIIVAIHASGLELVTVHDLPEGSGLGSYHYIIEVEDPEGISKKQIEKVLKIEQISFRGCFDWKEKGA